MEKQKRNIFQKSQDFKIDINNNLTYENNKKNDSIEYNLKRIQQILDWNDMRTFNDWPGGMDPVSKSKFFEQNINIARRIMLFDNVRISPHMDPNNEIKQKNDKIYKKYDEQNKIKNIEYGMLNMLQSINTSLNILNQRISKIEKLIDNKKTD